MPSPAAGPLGPIRIHLRRDIRAPAEVVWVLLVDWERAGRWMREATAFRVLTDHRQGVGVEVEARVRIGGITTVDTVRVTRWEPPRLLEIEHLGWVKGRALMRCIPTAEGTRLEWTERLVPPHGALGAIGIRAFKPLMTRVFNRDLAVLKGMAERGRAPVRKAQGAPGTDGAVPSGAPAGAGGPAAGTAPLEPPGTRTAPSGPRGSRSTGTEPARAGRRSHALFARWFWLVYVPLGLTAVLLLLLFAKLLPAAVATVLLPIAGVWSALALRLLVERRRKGLAVPAPRSIVLGIVTVGALALGGALLAWIGIGRVSSAEGLAMLLVGGFFILTAIFAPVFKLVDSVLRLAARLIKRHSSPRPAHAPPRPSGGAQTRPVPTEAPQPTGSKQ